MIAIVAPAIDAFETNTAGLIASVAQYEPEAQIVIVDNAVGYAAVPGVNMAHLHRRVSCAEAMNRGADLVNPRADWLLFMNNDVLCQGPVLPLLDTLKDDAIYGVDLLDWFGRRFIDGWVMAIPRRVWATVGEFDERFLVGAFEDADYCFRAEAAGFGVRRAPLPFVHRETHSRYNEPAFWERREDNKRYLFEKWGLKE